MKVEMKLTSVHVLDGIYKKFKINAIDGSINLQKLVNRSLELPAGLKDKSIRPDLDQLLAELKEHTSEDEIIHYYRWLNEKVYA